MRHVKMQINGIDYITFYTIHYIIKWNFRKGDSVYKILLLYILYLNFLKYHFCRVWIACTHALHYFSIKIIYCSNCLCINEKSFQFAVCKTRTKINCLPASLLLGEYNKIVQHLTWIWYRILIDIYRNKDLNCQYCIPNVS